MINESPHHPGYLFLRRRAIGFRRWMQTAHVIRKDILGSRVNSHTKFRNAMNKSDCILCIQNLAGVVLLICIQKFVEIWYTFYIHFVCISCTHLVQFLYTKCIHRFRVGISWWNKGFVIGLPWTYSHLTQYCFNFQ